MMAANDLQRSDDINKFYCLHDKKLGEGGFAKVCLGIHLITKQYVAIKCLDKVQLGPELPRIYNEIECLKRLKHRNIARLFQVFETDTIIYLVLEYCAGGELFDYIVSKTRLNEPEAAQILFDLMRVLDFIHINGFAHRDLKPENVLFDDKHQIKLIDFGLAANCSADNMALNNKQAPIDMLSTCCGSVTYAAPEVISGGLYSGTLVDVWSAGVMLYALLVGQLPFNDNSIPKLYQKIQAGIRSLPNYLSPEARDLIRKMLTVDPQKRVTVRDVLEHPWLRNRSNTHARISRRLNFVNNGHQLDEQLLARCCKLFPDIPIDKLRELIIQDFNYYSTAYYLMLSKCPPRATAIKRTPEKITVSPPPLAQPLHHQQPPTTPHKQPPQLPQVPPVTPYASPMKKTRFITVTNTPRTPKTPGALPSYLQQLHQHQLQIQQQSPAPSGLQEASANVQNIFTTPVKSRIPQSVTTPSNNNNINSNSKGKQQQENGSGNKMSAFIYNRTPKKSIVKRLLESATPGKLRQKRRVLMRKNVTPKTCIAVRGSVGGCSSCSGRGSHSEGCRLATTTTTCAAIGATPIATAAGGGSRGGGGPVRVEAGLKLGHDGGGEAGRQWWRWRLTRANTYSDLSSAAVSAARGRR